MMHVDAPFREVLGAAGLDTVARVLACEGDRLAAWSRTTDTVDGKQQVLPAKNWQQKGATVSIQVDTPVPAYRTVAFVLKLS